MDTKIYSPTIDIDHARALRETATKAEQCVWNFLRNRKMHGLKFRRQHPVLGFILDFACLEGKLAIELDGGQHNEPEKLASDAWRTQQLHKAGWRVLRVWNNEVLQNSEGVYAAIEAAFSEHES